MDSLLLKQPAESLKIHLNLINTNNSLTSSEQGRNGSAKVAPVISAPEHQLRKLEKHQDSLKEGSGALGAKHAKARLVSNKTHYSPSDLDARISIKPGKARRLNYHCSMAVDTGEGVITHIQADFANGRDSQYLPQLVMQLQDRLKASQLLLQDLLADAAYANGSNYAFLEQRGITGWIPVFGMYKPEVAGFPYDKEIDQYTCPIGKPLPFKGFDHTADGGLIKNNWAAPKDCRACSLKASCAPHTRCRKITRTAYDPEYLRAFARQ